MKHQLGQQKKGTMSELPHCLQATTNLLMEKATQHADDDQAALAMEEGRDPTLQPELDLPDDHLGAAYASASG